MRIALTHNLQITANEEEAEFDRPETIQALSDALRRLGHTVEPVEVSGPASRTVARLEALNPDMVFNTAEGRRGRFREAFYPALFDELAIPYTGSDAWVCALTLDKQLTKMVLAAEGVSVPRGRFVERATDLDTADLRFPVIVKPNYEGSSKGITQDSVVEDAPALQARVAELLGRYPTGVLVEEYVEGRDVAVPYIERVSTEADGVLEPTEYVYAGEAAAGRRWNIYDYHLKQEADDAVTVRVPAELPDHVSRDMRCTTREIMRTLGVRDVGRVDFRVGPDGRFHFLEVNALPSLQEGAGIYAAAARVGLGSMDAVLDAIVRSAAVRQGVQVVSRPRRRKGGPLKVGLTYNLKRVAPRPGGSSDAEAEYDAPATIAAIRGAVESYGHEVVELEATPELPRLIDESSLDFVFNIAEGIRGRNREAQIPALLELLDIEYTGSDPATLSLALDKALAKRVVRHHGIPTPDFLVMTSERQRLPKGFRFPAIVKPVAEGSSKGVFGTSVARDEGELRSVVSQMLGRYRQGALVETFLPGREFTVGLLGERRPRVLPPMEIVFVQPSSEFPVYTFDHKLEAKGEVRYDAPAKVDAALGREIERVARGAFQALGCRDVARVDLRLDDRGRVNFVECNPLPGLTPGWSDLCLIGEAAGIGYRQLVGEIMAPAIRRLRQREREREQGEQQRTASGEGGRG
ncbi:MAG: D-alanine--D-alanine ligase family protein [Myxococcota bacterium]